MRRHVWWWRCRTLRLVSRHLFKLVLYLAVAEECVCVSVEIMIMTKGTQVRMSNNKDDQLLTVFIS